MTEECKIFVYCFKTNSGSKNTQKLALTKWNNFMRERVAWKMRKIVTFDFHMYFDCVYKTDEKLNEQEKEQVNERVKIRTLQSNFPL